MAEPRATGAGPTAPAMVPGLITDEGIQNMLRDLAVQSMPQRTAMFSEAVRRQTGLAAGSSEAIRRTLMPQITALRQRLDDAFSALDRRLGPNAGRQIQGQRSGLLTEAGANLQALFGGAQQQGFTNLLGMLQGFRPAQLTQLPQPTTQTSPLDPSAFTQLGSSTASLVDAIINRPPTTTPAVTLPQTGSLGGGVGMA